MRRDRGDWREFGIIAAVALSVCGAVQAYAHRILWKLADSTYVLADWEGFAELAGTGPFGCIDWVARYLGATWLTGWGWLVTTALLAVAMVGGFLVRGMRPAVAAWLPAILFVVPLLGLGDGVWLLVAPHFLVWNLLWYFIFAAFAAVGGRKGLVGLLMLLVALVVGAYAVCDLPFEETVMRGFGFRPGFNWRPGDFVTLAVFVGFALFVFVDMPRMRPLVERAVLSLVLVVLTAVLWQNRDCRDQLAMERLVEERRFAEVLEVAPEKARPRRMESAWRMLAMYRTDRLDRDICRYPVSESIADTDEEEMVMEGPMFLFEFGLIQPFRRWTMETIAVKGWAPQYLRLLGEGAVISGDLALGLRKFRQLARCPFRGDLAERRVRALEAQPVDAAAFADLAELASMYEVWEHYVEENKIAYFGDDRNVERLVCNLFRTLKSGPTPMLKMSLVASVLSGHPEVIRANRDAIRNLYPDGNVPPVFVEALK